MFESQPTFLELSVPAVEGTSRMLVNIGSINAVEETNRPGIRYTRIYLNNSDAPIEVTDTYDLVVGYLSSCSANVLQ